MNRWNLACVVGAAALATGCLPGCGDGDPPEAAANQEATANQQAIAEMLVLAESDPEAALAAVNDLPGELDQLLAVEQLLINGPDLVLTQPSCNVLEQARPRDRCVSLVSRPHLLRTDRSSSKVMDQLDPAALDAQFACLGVASGGSRTPLQVALSHVRQAPPGDPSVEETCECLGDPDQRGECRFEGAQRLIQETGASALGQALALCDVGGGLARDCTSHILETGIETVPPVCDGQERDWAMLFIAGHGLQDLAPERGEEAEQRRWARVTSTVFANGFCLPPELGAALPAAARPQIHAAAAWWAVAHSPDPLSLEDVRPRALQALRGEAGLTDRDGELPRISRGGGPAQAERPPAMPDGVAATAFLATSHRARAEDEDADLAICILEVAARQGRPIGTLLEEAAAQDDDALRHTASRLRP